MGLRKEFLYVFFFSLLLVSSLVVCGILLNDSGVVEDDEKFYSHVVVNQRLDEAFIGDPSWFDGVNMTFGE
jgi:hypothetical protein